MSAPVMGTPTQPVPTRIHKKTSPRLDQWLVERGLALSREKAQRAILAGMVRVNDQRATKPSQAIAASDVVKFESPEKYVSRGGQKLEHALNAFGLDPAGWQTIDLGASTGGFTDCLLQHGAARVAAVDVGHGQLAWKLRTDPRVIVMEKINARHLKITDFPKEFTPIDASVIDCSFISLKLILPKAYELIRIGGKIIALIKPQFEAGKAEVDRGKGVIVDPEIHSRVLQEIETFVLTQYGSGLKWLGVTPSPILGPAGNKEFLVALEKVQ